MTFFFFNNLNSRIFVLFCFILACTSDKKSSFSTCFNLYHLQKKKAWTSHKTNRVAANLQRILPAFISKSSGSSIIHSRCFPLNICIWSICLSYGTQNRIASLAELLAERSVLYIDLIDLTTGAHALDPPPRHTNPCLVVSSQVSESLLFTC